MFRIEYENSLVSVVACFFFDFLREDRQFDQTVYSVISDHVVL